MLPDERSESKRVNSAVELEERESRADCFRHLEESPLFWWKGVVSKSDIAFFQAGVTDAQRVSTFIYFLISAGLFFTLAFVCRRKRMREPNGVTGFCTTSYGAWGLLKRSLLKQSLGWPMSIAIHTRGRNSRRFGTNFERPRWSFRSLGIDAMEPRFRWPRWRES